MKTFSKIILALIAFVLTFNFSICGKVNHLKLINIEYTRGGNKVKYAMKYDKLSLEHDLADESDINSFSLKYTWEFSNDEEKTKAETMLTDIKNDFDNAVIDGNSLSIIFLAKDIANLKLFKKTEFGSAFIVEVDQKGNKVALQFQIPKDQQYQDDLHDLIQKIVDSHKASFLQHISLQANIEAFDSLEFLQ